MTEGIFWSLLLVFFFFIAILGWSEYRKIEAYRCWAMQFDQAKYDIYAVLGQKGDQLTWGQPTRSGPINIEQVSLNQIEAIDLYVDGKVVDPQALPSRGKQISLNLQLRNLSTENTPQVLKIPFTEVDLAAQWAKHLQMSLIV